MTRSGKDAVRIYLRTDSECNSTDDDEAEVGYAEKFLQWAKKIKKWKIEISKYRCTSLVVCTSNTLERQCSSGFGYHVILMTNTKTGIYWCVYLLNSDTHMYGYSVNTTLFNNSIAIYCSLALLQGLNNKVKQMDDAVLYWMLTYLS